MTTPTATETTARNHLDVLPTGTRPASPDPLTASLLFAWRAVLKIKHVPQQLGDVIGVPIVFTLMFTYLFGGALAGSPNRYLQSLLPGTLVLAVLLGGWCFSWA